MAETDSQNSCELPIPESKNGFDIGFDPVGIQTFFCSVGEMFSGIFLCVLLTTPLDEPMPHLAHWEIPGLLAGMLFLFCSWSSFISQFRKLYGYRPEWKERRFRLELKAYLLSEFSVLLFWGAFALFLSALTEKSLWPALSYSLAAVVLLLSCICKGAYKGFKRSNLTRTKAFFARNED